MFRVVHIVTSDNGGAGRACVRLHSALLKAGLESFIITKNKSSNLNNIQELKQSKFNKSLTKSIRNISLLPFRSSIKKASDYFSPNINIPFLSDNNKSLLQQIDSISPDIIHLHWIEGGFVNIHSLASITKPIIWSLHDENAYTGGCHYVANGCNENMFKCKLCPLLPKPSRVSYLTFINKQETYKKINITINGLSSWIATRAKESLLLQDKSIINLPNPIDTNLYKPLNKAFARKALCIDSNKILLAFGAIGGSSIKRKGFAQLKAALEMLNDKNKYELVVFGGQSQDIDGINVINLDVLHDDATLVLLYNACDIFIQPSLAENLSNAIMESLSCGTPVIAFNIGGNMDMINHKINGYLAKPLDAKDLSNGIEWFANLNLEQKEDISNNARNSILSKFDYKVVAPMYIAVYKEMLGGGGNPSIIL
ncbi:glycosyltransferase [Helicobacter muridarum]|uniref:Glycosyl transferase n=1 Tax=Helicobacter muridarum TaxID=216 RepID=A0A377PX91_9HELI|nr:glycosyltransferase [Helicobacter muridarum]STQ87074.1 glycosyl transferase [Helicobacter muridarum]